MHFFYMDESGDTGRNLEDADQPIMVLAGVALRDKSWNKTQNALQECFEKFFGGAVPPDFEFHASKALSPTGGGHFAGVALADRASLALELLQILGQNRHGCFYTAVRKSAMKTTPLGATIEYNPKRPYPVAFDANLSAINQYVKARLGTSARGMLFFDEKQVHHDDVRRLMRARRFEVPQAHRVKWVVEFGHPVDSRANPMIQLADLVAYATRAFLELEYQCGGAKTDEMTQVLARCYRVIDERLLWRTATARTENTHVKIGPYLDAVTIRPKAGWKKRYAS